MSKNISIIILLILAIVLVWKANENKEQHEREVQLLKLSIDSTEGEIYRLKKQIETDSLVIHFKTLEIEEISRTKNKIYENYKKQTIDTLSNDERTKLLTRLGYE